MIYDLYCDRPECRSAVGCGHRGPKGEYCWFLAPPLTPEQEAAERYPVIPFGYMAERERAAYLKGHASGYAKAKTAITDEMGEDFWNETAHFDDEAFIEVPIGLLRALAAPADPEKGG